MTESKHDAVQLSRETVHQSPPCTPHKRRKKSVTLPAPKPTRPPQPATHRRIMTRSRTRIFRFLDLPPELRNLIYEFAFSRSEPTPLTDLRLPASLRASRTLYTEARPLFFLTTPVVVHVRCNWCVRYHHLHSEHHLRYDETGRVCGAIPAMLRGPAALPAAIARFRTVRFNIQCCCCDVPKVIATMLVRVVAGRDGGLVIAARAEVMDGPKICPKVVDGLLRMFADAEGVMKGFGKRPAFNGLTVGDLEVVARCFREEGDGHSDSGSDS